MPTRAVKYDENGEPVPFERKLKDNGPLHRLMIKACPPDPETGAKSIGVLATKIDVSRQALNKAVSKNSMTPGLAIKIVDVAEGRVTLADFSPFYLM